MPLSKSGAVDLLVALYGDEMRPMRDCIGQFPGRPFWQRVGGWCALGSLNSNGLSNDREVLADG